MDAEDYSFAIFFQIWATSQRWVVPDVHSQIISFLDDDDWDNDTKVLLLWRGVGKSTIADLWVAYMLSINPTLTFLILSADFTTAKKSSQDILFIIRNHPLCKHLVSDQHETRKDSFYVNGSTDKRNPSVRANGVLSNITGGRADYILYDDVEVKKNSGAESKRDDLRAKLSESAHLLTPEHGRRLFIGTFHDAISIYDEEVDDGASKLLMPLINLPEGDYPQITGKSNWETRFNQAKIAQIQKRCNGKAEFYSQYLLIPTGIEESLLDPTLARVYQDIFSIKIVNKTTVATIGEHVIKSVSAWWDPSLSGARRDDSVLAIVFTCTHGNVFVHRTISLIGDVDAQCLQAKDYLKRFNIPNIKIESNALAGFLVQVMIKHMKGTGIGVTGVSSTQSKNEKIISQLETPLFGGYLYISEQVKNGKFLSQMRDFDASNNRNKDDYIDAVASAINEEPIRVAGMPINVVDGINTKWIGDGGMEVVRDTFQL